MHLIAIMPVRKAKRSWLPSIPRGQPRTPPRPVDDPTGSARCVLEPHSSTARSKRRDEAEILEHGRGEKVVAFKKKRRKNTHRKRGHRQPYTKLKITAIQAGE